MAKTTTDKATDTTVSKEDIRARVEQVFADLTDKLRSAIDRYDDRLHADIAAAKASVLETHDIDPSTPAPTDAASDEAAK